MRIEMPPWLLITLNIIGWPIIQLSIAWVMLRLPSRWFRNCRAGRTSRAPLSIFSVRSWKRFLPDAAPWFRGGFAKAALKERSPDYLRRFEIETRRAEIAHGLMMLSTPIFFLWNPIWADGVMIFYAVFANVPCMLVQRFNRARLIEIRERLSFSPLRTG